MPTCEYCGKEFYAGDGVWDNGDYTCGECIARHIEESERTDKKTTDEPAATPKKTQA